MKRIKVKSHTSLLTLFLTLFTIISHGQITNFPIELFKPDSLPQCVGYSEDEQIYFGAIYHTDTIDGELEDVFETSNGYEKDSSLLLPKDFIRNHLLSDSKIIYSLDDKSKDTIYSESLEDYLTADFYAISSLVETKKFHVVLYERVFAYGGIPSSEKFICTFNKKGKFLSRVLIASFIFSGTGYSLSGARVPWYPEEKGCINKDLSINFTSQTSGEKKYQIQPNGSIVDIK